MIWRILAAVIVIWLLGFAAFAMTLPQPEPPAKSDGIVVLTGGAKRIDRALDLLQDGKADRLLISGVDSEVRPNELAAEYDSPEKLFECCVDLGFQSIDTRSNALETARWVARHDVKTLRLVTHDWHMRRARLELDQAMDADVSIVNDAVQTSPSLGVLFREYNKYWLRWTAAMIGV